MKKSFILFFILFIVFISSSPAQAGYWQLSGDGWIQWDRTGANAEGTEPSKINSIDINHVDMSVTDIQGKTTRVIYTWGTPPQIIRQDEMVPVSVSYIISGPQKGGCDVMWDYMTLINFRLSNDNPPEGKIINTQIKSPKNTQNFTLVYGCFNFGANSDVRFSYKWVEDETPPVSQPSTNSKTLAAGETWNVGEGYTLKAGAIDAKAGQIWLILSKNGKQVDESYVNVGETYTYSNIKIKITKISAGAVSDTVTLTDASTASSSPGITPRVSPGITPGVPVTPSTTCYDNGMGASGGNCIYSNGNAGGVYNNPTSQTTFTLTNTYNVMSISTYHYNSGRGATPGTISLKDSSGKTVGKWTATGRYGNFYWDVTPNIKLGPGTYTVIDSDTSTWAQNSETNNQGMFIVKGTLGIMPDKGTTTVTAKRTTPKPGATTPQGDFTVSISPTEMTVDPGENIRFTLTVEPEGDFNEPVEIYVKTEALGIEKDYGRVKIINPPYKPYVFEKQVPDSIPKGTTITGYVTAKSGGLERDAGTVTVNVPGFGTLLAIGALGMAILLRKRR